MDTSPRRSPGPQPLLDTRLTSAERRQLAQLAVAAVALIIAGANLHITSVNAVLFRIPVPTIMLILVAAAVGAVVALRFRLVLADRAMRHVRSRERGADHHVRPVGHVGLLRDGHQHPDRAASHPR